MSAPLLWIGFPAVLSVIAFIFRRWKRIVTISVSLSTILLALCAWIFQIGELLTIGPWSFTISDRLLVFGRQFILGNPDRPLLMMIYLTVTFFFVGSLAINISVFFIPLALGMSVFLVASLSVQPFLYAALIIEIAVLIGVPLLSPPGTKIERGVLRYLTFLSFGFPFMLIGGDLLARDVAEIVKPEVITPPLVILGFGFVFLLSIFPFNNWIPLLMEESHPYSSIFVLSLLPTIVIALLLRFVRQYPWLLDIDIINMIGILMVVSGGLWAAFQRNLGRLLGYAVIIEIGYSLLAITLPERSDIYLPQILLPRILAFGVWGLSLSLIKKFTGDLQFRSIQGMGIRAPIIVLGSLVANFSLAGLPMLAGFPSLFTLWSQLVKISSSTTFLVMMGSVGLLIGGLRSMAVFVMGSTDTEQNEIRIGPVSHLLLIVGILSIIIVGMFPQWIYRFTSNLVGIM